MHRCKFCFINFTMAGLKFHLKSFHEGENFSKCPYGTLLQDFCPIGCSYKPTDKSNMRRHLILYHSEN